MYVRSRSDAFPSDGGYPLRIVRPGGRSGQVNSRTSTGGSAARA
jgi:hypothetical protein